MMKSDRIIRGAPGILLRLLVVGVTAAAVTLMFVVIAGLFVVSARADEPASAPLRIRQLAPLPTPATRPVVGRTALEGGAEVIEFARPTPTPTVTPTMTPTPVVEPDIKEENAAPLPTPAAVESSPLVGWPVGGRVSQGFGCSPFFTGVPGPDCPANAPWFHDGLDIAAAQGAPVRAALAGVVAFAGPDDAGPPCGEYRGFGLKVIIRTAAGWQTLYGHLSRIDVAPGQPVTANTLIGAAGATGCASGPHLHFGLKQRGELLDPALYIPEVTP